MSLTQGDILGFLIPDEVNALQRAKETLDIAQGDYAIALKRFEESKTIALQQLASLNPCENANMDSATVPTMVTTTEEETQVPPPIETSISGNDGDFDEPQTIKSYGLAALSDAAKLELQSLVNASINAGEAKGDISPESGKRTICSPEHDEGDRKRSKTAPFIQEQTRRFIQRERWLIRKIFEDAKHRTGEDVLKCEITKGNNCVVPPEMKIKYKLPAGIQGTALRYGKQNFTVVLNNILLSGTKVGLQQNHLNFEDPRDCADVIHQLKALFNKFREEDELRN